MVSSHKTSQRHKPEDLDLFQDVVHSELLKGIISVIKVGMCLSALLEIRGRPLCLLACRMRPFQSDRGPVSCAGKKNFWLNNLEINQSYWLRISYSYVRMYDINVTEFSNRHILQFISKTVVDSQCYCIISSICENMFLKEGFNSIAM